MALVWERDVENGSGVWGLYDDGNFVAEIYPLGDCFRWRDEVSSTRHVEPSLAAAQSACRARYEDAKAVLVQRGQWPPGWLPWNALGEQALS